MLFFDFSAFNKSHPSFSVAFKPAKKYLSNVFQEQQKICLAWYHFLAGKCNDYQTIIYTLMTCSSKWTGISKYSRRRASLRLSPAVNDLSAAQTYFLFHLLG